MGIGHQALAVFEELIKNKDFNNCKSVIEFGSQILNENCQERAKTIIKKKKRQSLNRETDCKRFLFKLGIQRI